MKQFCGFLNKFIKSIDCLLYDLLIAKIYAYGFDMAPLKSVYTYQCGKKLQGKKNDECSSWRKFCSFFLMTPFWDR